MAGFLTGETILSRMRILFNQVCGLQAERRRVDRIRLISFSTANALKRIFNLTSTKDMFETGGMILNHISDPGCISLIN